MSAVQRQTKEDREYILTNLPAGVRRVQVIEPSGKQVYKRPDDVDTTLDQIMLASDGTPICMRGKPGRKKKPVLNSVTPQIAEIEAAREEHLTQDSLRREARSDAESDNVLNGIIAAMADEAAAIEFERAEAARHGQDTANHSSKRARVLKAMADTWLKRRQQVEGGIIDLDSPAFSALFAMILETFKGVMADSGTRPEHIETIFVKLVSELGEDSWREEAKVRMKDKIK
jgi:hypothetical protein